MNGYMVMLMEITFVGTVWYLGGTMLGLIALTYCGIMAWVQIRYNRFVFAMVDMFKARIRELGGEI